MKSLALLPLLLAAALIVGCGGAKEPPSSAILGKWTNAGVDDNMIEFRDDGTVSIVGDDPENRLDGTYKFLDESNLEFQLPITAESWLPNWLPGGVRRNPHIRAYVAPAGDDLELRARVEIIAGNIVQYIEVPTVRFKRIVDG